LALLKTSNPVRGELVEPHLHQQNQPLTNRRFGKLRWPSLIKTGASGIFLEAPFDAQNAACSSISAMGLSYHHSVGIA
jgi:hypothetical protein